MTPHEERIDKALDSLSHARTALDDPGALDGEWRRPSTPESEAPSAYAIDKIDDAMRLLDPEQGNAPTHVVVCVSGISGSWTGQAIFGIKVYGPFPEEEVETKAREIQSFEGGATFVRPLIDLADTYRRMSAD